jgi:hypothetical protein
LEPEQPLLRREIAFFQRLKKWTGKQIQFIAKSVSYFKDKPGTQLSAPILCDLKRYHAHDYSCGAFFAKVLNHLNCLCTETCDRFSYICKATGDAHMDDLLKEGLFFDRLQVWIVRHLEERGEALQSLSVYHQPTPLISDVAGQHRVDIGPSANISDNGFPHYRIDNAKGDVARGGHRIDSSKFPKQEFKQELVAPLIQTRSEPTQRLLKRPMTQDPEDTDSDEDPPAKRERGSREVNFWTGFGEFARIQGSKTGIPTMVTETKNKYYQTLFEFGRRMPGKWFSKDAAIEAGNAQLQFTLTHITGANCPNPNSLVSVKVGRLAYFMVWEPKQ